MNKFINILKKANPSNIIPPIIALVVLTLTIGFSAYQANLVVDAGALVRIQKDIRITGVIASNTSSDGISNWEEYNVSNISSSINLPNSDSTVTYRVTIKNIGNIEAGILKITGLPDNLKYTLSNYNLEDPLCDDNDSTKCKLGSTTTIEITIGYNENGYDSSSTTQVFNMNFDFFYFGAIARIGDEFYDTLQNAVNAVPANNTQTTVKLLASTSEIITVAKDKNIIFDFGNNVLSNVGNNPVISNYGTVVISNGMITSSAPKNGAVNNESTGNITITGGSIVVTGGRQALYNNKGVAEISGTAYLSSVATERAAVQNVAGGTMTIKGGTIISTGSSAVVSASTLTIGEKDNNINKTSPILQGITYGISSSANYSFYNGTIKGKTKAYNNLNHIVDTEEGYSVVSSEENIDGQLYNIAYLGIHYEVTFDGNGGTPSETKRNVEKNQKIGTLPTGTRTGYELIGWFTAKEGGEEITKDTIITSDTKFYARWEKTDVALLNGTYYQSIQDAIDTVPTNNTETTITIIRNTKENVTVYKNMNIKFDLQNYTVSNSTNKAVIENNGTVKIINGTLTSKTDTAVINNNASASLLISGGNVLATGTRQAVYNLDGGYVEITGSAYLSSKTSGKPTYSNLNRATIQNLAGGTVVISGGTIVGEIQNAIANEGTMSLGIKDGNIITSTPIIRGETYGIENAGTLNFYDGKIMGITGTIQGNTDDLDGNITSSTEVLNDKTYYIAYLN